MINKARDYFRLSNLEKHTQASGILRLVGGDALCSLEDDSGRYASEGDSDLSIFLKSTHVGFAYFLILSVQMFGQGINTLHFKQASLW